MTVEEQKRIFEEWLKLHKGLIFKIIRAYADTSMDREDLFQEITIQVWRSIPSFRHESAVTTWIYRIALNVAIRWIRKERKHPQPESLDTVPFILEENRSHIDDERLAWLYAEIHKLDEIERSITLLMLDGFSYKEMSSVLGITESHVGVKINRIKKQLIIRSRKFDYHGI